MSDKSNVNLAHEVVSKCNINPDLLLEGSFFVTFLNPYSYGVGRKFSAVFKRFDAIYVDGISLVILLKLFGVKCKRMSFDSTSMAKVLFNYCEASGKTIYFIGAKQEEIDESIRNFKFQFPQLNIVGYRNGYIKTPEEKKDLISDIMRMNPDFVISGMGTPLQEAFLLNLKDAGYKGTGFTCGGFLHQSAKGVKYYPEIYNKLHLRWLYRIMDEPKLLKRYLFDYPRAAFLFIIDYFKSPA